MTGPIFIGGCPRSGTTALWNALIQHPNLAPTPGMSRDKELWFLAEFFEHRKPEQVGWRSHPLDAEYEREAVLFIDDFLKRHCGSQTGRYVTAYGNNILHAENIARLIPDSRILLLIRHPQDNVWSLLNAFFSGYIRRSRNVELITIPEIKRATEIWKERAYIVLRALAGELGENVRVVRQEDIVKNPEAVARSVLEFVDEPFEQSVADALAYGVINTSFPPGREPSEKSFLEVIPIADSQAREAFFTQNRQRLIEAPNVCQVVRELAAAAMRALGYEDLQQAVASTSPKPTSLDRVAEIAETAILDNDGRPQVRYSPTEHATLRIIVKANQPVRNLSVSYLVRDSEGLHLFGTTTFDEGVKLPDLQAGQKLCVRFSFPAAIRLGRYSVCVSCNSVSMPGYADNVLHHQIDDAVFFNVDYVQQRPVHYKFLLPTAIAVDLPK